MAPMLVSKETAGTPETKLRKFQDKLYMQQLWQF